MTFREQLVLTAVTGAAAFVGVLVGSWFNARREAKARHDAYVSKLVERRYDLYQRYINILDRHQDELTGADLLTDMGVTISDTHKVEREMRLFASDDVLAIADEYRDHLRSVAQTWSGLNETQRNELDAKLHLAKGRLVIRGAVHGGSCRGAGDLSRPPGVDLPVHRTAARPVPQAGPAGRRAWR
ncbi:hypothetical protein OG994_25770 [Micromonospora globbae]|uniref:Uncharacterized protein n=1 Tax=Micromonospora globbae TaxID=1894969 RepID=A0ABZ1S4J4_9ACTN|nr:hypothetical protein [Micromonospora globbae]